MPSPLYDRNSVMGTLCHKCGDRGFQEFLVYCSKCALSAEHSYCLDVVPKDNGKEEEFIWFCEDCLPCFTKIPPLSSVPTRRSMRTKPRSNGAAKTIRNLKRQENIDILVATAEGQRETETGAVTGTKEQTSAVVSASHISKPYVDLLLKPKLDENSRSPHSAGANSDGDPELKKQKRRLILDDCDSSGEEAEDVAYPEPELNESNRNPPSSDANSDEKRVQKQKRRLILDEHESSDEESEHSKHRELQVEAEAETEAKQQTCTLASSLQTLKPYMEDLPPLESNENNRRIQHSSTVNSDGDQELKKQMKRLAVDVDMDVDNCYSSDEEAEYAKSKKLLVVPHVSSAAPIEFSSHHPSGDNRRIQHSSTVNSDGDQELKKQMKRLAVDVDVDNCYSSGEETEYAKSKKLLVVPHVSSAAPIEFSSHHPSGEFDDYVHAQPIIDPAWRGWFGIRDEKFGKIVGHLSSKACLKVLEGANSLPPLLSVEVVPRLDAWPKSFQVASPTDENIALYFFPGDERVGIAFDGLLQDIILRDLALKAVIDDAELLIFSSYQLPDHYRVFNDRYYLWGVFRSRKGRTPHRSDADSVMPMSGLSSNGRKGLRVGSPSSPLSTGSSYGCYREWKAENPMDV